MDRDGASHFTEFQFAFTISFHIIFRHSRSGLSAWVDRSRSAHLRTERPVYQVLFEFWLKLFGGLRDWGVVIRDCGWHSSRHELERIVQMSGPIQGPL